MPRLPRCLQLRDAVCFHVLNRGHNCETTFVDDEDRRAFLSLLARDRRRFGLRLYHYCLMSNHYHVLLRPDDATRLSALLAGLQRAYVHHCHRRHGFAGHRWQGRFKSPAVQDGAYLPRCARYLERNPVEAGLCALPWEYPWSSCRSYGLGEPNALVDENPDYTALAATAGERQARWRAFLLGVDALEAEVRQEGWALGDAHFRRGLHLATGRPVRCRGRPRGAKRTPREGFLF